MGKYETEEVRKRKKKGKEGKEEKEENRKHINISFMKKKRRTGK